jgi:predicted permease
LLNDLFYRIRALFRHRIVEAELDEELQYHLARQTERLIQSGVVPKEAARRARIAFGGPEQVRQQSRDGRGTRLLEDLFDDARYALRTLAKSPAFAVVAIFTLALGIGASTAIFSLIHAVLLRSLPYGEPSRLVYLFTPNPRYNLPPEIFSPSNADFFDLKKQSQSFSDMTLFSQVSYSLATAETTLRVDAAKVDSDFFSTLQTVPELGRTITIDDNQPGRDRVTILSHALWQSTFNERADILTQSVLLDGKSYRIVGVMPTAFQYPQSSDLRYGNPGSAQTQIWTPLALTPKEQADRESDRGNVIARLKPKISIPQAQAEMSSLMSHLNRLHDPDSRGWGALVQNFNDHAVGSVRPLMATLLGAVAFVLLIACGNAANLLLARAVNRTHELSVRTVLGAGRSRVIRQLLTESIILGSAAGIVGVFLAFFFLHLLLRLNPGDIPRLNEASLNAPVLLFAIFITLLTSLLFGALPALSLSRVDLIGMLKATGSRGVILARNRLRNALIVFQVALVFILLAGAGLLIHSYLNVSAVQPGFSQSTVSMNIQLDDRYSQPQQRLTFFRTLIDKLAATPGISATGAVNYLPLSNSESLSSFSVDGYANQKDQLVEARDATPDYFSVMNIPLLEGRLLAESDAHLPTVLINQAFAKQYFAGTGPIGRQIHLGDVSAPPVTVIGVLGDVRNMNLEDAAPPQVYSAFSQTDARGAYIVVRSALPPDAVAAVVHTALKTIDPTLAVSGIHTMGQLVSEASARRRFQTVLLAIFAAIALLLAMVGFYGLIAYAVKQRSGEIGIRMALGASRKAVLNMILGEGLQLVIVGLIFGLIGALALTRIMSAFLYNVHPIDPLTFLAVPSLLLLVTVAACALPAWKAASTDPTQAIRSE